MRLYRYIYCWLLVCACGLSLSAQQTAPVTDTSQVYSSTDDTDERTVAEDSVEVAGGLQPSWGFVLNRNMLPEDTVMYIRRNTWYIGTMDSLLRVMKKESEKNISKNDNADLSGKSWLESVLQSSITRVLFTILAVAFVLFIIYRLFFTQGVFTRSKRVNNVVVEDEYPASGQDVDYKRIINDALAKGDYRMAVRGNFLQILQLLAKGGYIVPGTDKTNYQYVRELAMPQWRNDFSALVMYYEYVWYGEIEIDEAIYGNIEARFIQFKNKC